WTARTSNAAVKRRPPGRSPGPWNRGRPETRSLIHSHIPKGPSDMTVADTAAPALTGTRLADYLQLTRPRLCAMALLTVAAGAVLASGGTPDRRGMTHAMAGAALVAAGASALNQWSEREVDARMRRTRDRPLPAGRLQPGEVLVLGIASAAGGVV